MNKLDTLLYLAHRGFHLFPLLFNSKHPAVEGWQGWATRDPAQIESWYLRNPDHNWGISTSKFGLNDHLCVIDVDNKNGKDGEESIARLSLLEGEFPQTIETRTPTGGRHLLYVTDKPLRNTAGRLGRGIDTRGLGGYVVAPGSAIDGTPYELVNGTTPHALPEWLEKRIGVPPQKSAKSAIENLDTESAIRQAQAYLAGAPYAVEGDAGDLNTYKVAARLKDFGLSESVAFDLMLSEWNDYCSPPWEPEALKVKVANAYAYGNEPVGIRSVQAAGFEAITPEEIHPLEIEEVGEFDEGLLPPYRHILGDFLIKGYVTAVIAAPAVGKSLLTLTAAVAIATGREDLTSYPAVEKGPVLVINNEDDNLDMKKRLKALCRLKGIIHADYKGRLFFKGGARTPVRLATLNTAGNVVMTKDVPPLMDFIIAKGIKAVIFDPLVEFHGVNENDNAQMGAVVAILRQIAIQCDCAVLIVHHTRKPGVADPDSHRGNLDTARGGSSFGGNVRRAFTLFEMSEREAARFGIADAKRRRYMVLDDAKANHSEKSAKARWFFKEGVSLVNGDNVVAMRPVGPDELRDRQADFGPMVAEEILAISNERNEAIFTLTDICRHLVARPLYSDHANNLGAPKTAFRDNVRDALESGIEINGFRIACIQRESATGGRPSRHSVEIEKIV